MAFQIGTATGIDNLLSTIRTFLQAGSNASATLTITANPSNGETVTLGAKTYTFQTTLTDADGNVKIGATPEESLDNLVQAVRLVALGAGTAFAASTTLHPTIIAARGAGLTIGFRAKTAGAGGNSLATTETLANGSFGGGTMSGGGTGGWTELGYDGTNKTAIFRAPGLSGTEEIHIGLGYVQNVPADAYALTGWMFRSHNGSLGHQAQPGHSGLGYHPASNSLMPYWLFASGQRVMIVTKISTVYTASYLGKFFPYGTPGEYPQPYYRALPYFDNTRFSTVSEYFRNFWEPGAHDGSMMLNPNGNWYQVGDFFDSSGENRAQTGNYVWPFNADLGDGAGSAFTRYRELRENLDGSMLLLPMEICGENPSVDIYGELDGVYACPAFGAVSEDTITVDGHLYVLLQSTYHTARYYYAALELF